MYEPDDGGVHAGGITKLKDFGGLDMDQLHLKGPTDPNMDNLDLYSSLQKH